MPQDRNFWNGARYDPDAAGGHYESWFQRANHPDRPLAFWIRYTVFSPKNRPDDAVGELWAIYFDGEKQRVTAVRECVPIAVCRFSRAALDVRIGDAALDQRGLEGRAASGASAIAWDLRYVGDAPPLLLLPERYYARGFPKAKALVGTPFARYDGRLVVNGEAVEIRDWVGSQNHNWGSQHTDRYAWGQVAGFDDAPDVFLECSTARVKIGPLWSPWFTLLVLRLSGEEFALNGLLRGMRAQGRYDYFRWRFDTQNADVRIHGHIEAPKQAFACLRYGNPPGGSKTCLNTKIASCTITLERTGRSAQTFTTAHRAAFEILTDDDAHGIGTMV